MDKSNICSLWNKFTTWSIFLFCVFFYCCHCLDSLDKEFDSSSEQDQPKQFVINQEKRVLIVRGKSQIYELNDRLEKNKNVPSSENGHNDYLMIIMPDSERLLICQHNGKCEIRNLTDLSPMFRDPRTVFICQSGQKMKTFVGIASDLKSSPGLAPVFGRSYCGDPATTIISATEKDTLAPIFNYIINLINEKVVRTYPVYFRGVVQYPRFILFFTNQKISTKSKLFTSKIIKLCTDSEENRRVTYEDIPITCQRGNKEYRLLQHATLLRVSENDKLAAEMCQNKSDCAVIIGVFSSGNDPENPDFSSAVCVFAMDTILQTFMESRRRNLVGTSNRFDGGYMIFLGTAAFNLSEQSFDNDTNLNNREFCSYSNKLNLMSNVTLQGNALYENKTTRFTKIESLMTNGYAHVYIGTSDGRLLELYIKNKLESRVIGNYVTVEDGKEVREMGQLNKSIYALTENKIVKVGSVNCAMYTTCEDCNKKAGIPACGWSILTGKCTKLEDLQKNLKDYWLPAAEQKCLTLILDKSGVIIGSGSVDVNITTDPPINININGFQCRYLEKPKSVTDNSCKGINPQKDHRQYPFELLANVSGSFKVVASTLFWTYDCSKFLTCNECVKNFDKKITCFWCKEKATCTKNTNNCNGEDFINNASTCPSLNKSEVIRIPYNIMENKTFLGTNIPQKNQSVHNFQCNINGKNFSVSEVNTDSITCQNLEVQMPSPLKQNVTVTVTVYFRNRILDTTDIEVYSCEILGRDCSTCKYFKAENYSCNWCNSSNQCQYDKECPASTECPAPQITNISPENGTLGGNTKVVIEGRNLGVNDDSITHLSLAEKNCLRRTKIDFQKLECITSSSATESNGPVQITVDGKSSKYGNFAYMDPSLSSISPDTIIKEGGVWLTISGRNLNVGNQKYEIHLNDSAENKNIRCRKSSLLKDNSITCLVDKYICQADKCKEKDVVENLFVKFDKITKKKLAVNFTYVSNPTNVKISHNKSFVSGGRNLTVTGSNIEYVIKATFNDETCVRFKEKNFICPSPKKNETSARRKRSTAENRTVVLHLDGFQKKFQITYVSDPIIHKFKEDKELNSGKNEYVVIKGENMNLAADMNDYVVDIGATLCQITDLNTTYLECLPQLHIVGESGRYRVRVRVGNILEEVGYVKYIAAINVLMIVSIVLSVFIVAIIIGVVLLVRRLKLKKEQAVEKIWLVVRENEEKQRNTMKEEFAMMQTSIKVIKQDVVTTGMPFFDFEHYAFNQLFPKEDYNDHILMKQIPVHNDNRSAVEKAMMDLDKLIFNKFFITSVIFTLDKERKCTMRDRAQFASLLSVLFLSKMDYFLEVIKLLLSSLIERTPKQQKKTLFRRAESISTRLLSDWLSLAIYSYLKEGRGAHLFMLYKATQTLMETCPVDAVTGDSEITLSQEKLLKDTVETETLELTVELGDSGKMYPCKVLDCDTIHQAKAKCLYYIYKNKPASEIPQADDVELEWHEGKAGKLVLLDVSGTNEKQNRYIRLNTLKDYCVKEGSQMALVGKYEDDEIYENTLKSHAMNGIPVDEHQVKVELEPDDILWHLVKPHLEDEKVHKPKIHVADEVYLNRLVRTKLALKEYINNIFDNVIDAENMDPAIKYIFSLMDKFGNENDVESETIQIWKSDIYANRIWASLITRPEVVFDIQKATHVEPSLDVIRQALIDSFSMVPHKLGKNSPTQKLLFASEVKLAQEKVQAMYKSLASEDPISEKDMRQIMIQFSSQHGQIGFNKYSVLYQLFLFIRSYIHEILTDLDENADTSELELGGKLDKVIQQMDIEGIGNLNGNATNGSLYTRYV